MYQPGFFPPACVAALGLTFLASCVAPPRAPSAPATVAPIVQPADRIAGASQSTLILSENGKAAQPIILSANASDKLRATAEYFAAKLEKISGAKFEIQTGDGTRGIVLGTWQQFPIASLKKPLEVRQPVAHSNINNGAEAFAIKTETQRVLLLGGGEDGVSHAVSRFLELLGYRQFYPSPAWEVVPSISKLQWNRDVIDRPSIPTRVIWYAYNVAGDAPTPENITQSYEQLSARSRRDLQNWARQNRLGESFKIYNAHNYYWLTVGENQAEFEAHPEYYGLIDGKRTPGTICDSNPEVRRLTAKMAVWYLKKYTDGEMFSLEPHDGDGMCKCEKCLAVGSVSDRAFALANHAARVLQKELPGKMIGMLAYNQHDVPPTFDIEPNVHVAVARLFITGPYPFRELIRMWREKTPNVGVYEYFSTYQHGQDRLRARVSAGPTADLDALQSTIRYLAAQGVLSLTSESSVAWGAHGRGNYLATKLMWNPQTDINATLHDFYAKAFGPAAAPMKRYFERVDGDNEHFSTTLLGLAMRDVQEASTLAKGHPDVLSRLREIKQFLYYNYLQYRALNAKDKAEGKPWMAKLIEHEYRTRYSYMTHWHAMTFHLDAIAKEYGEPRWSFANADEIAAAKKEGKPFRTPPWQNEAEYSDEETERNFQEALQFFKPTPVLPKAEYSNDLVPIEWGNDKATTDFQVAEFRRGTVYLYSVKGEPIEVDLVGAKSETATFYLMEDKDGKQVASGTIPADDEKHHITFKVPRAGLYLLKGTARAWWLYSVAPGTPNTLMLADQQEISGWTYQGHEGRSFFYVPKGTKEIQFFWGGEAHKIFDAEGNIISEVPASSDYITIAVPAGKDGTIWSFSGRHQPRRFVNIPNTISPQPQSLMLPRELAIKDGLKIRQ